jgi:hypothetical protein
VRVCVVWGLPKWVASSELLNIVRRLSRETCEYNRPVNDSELSGPKE